MISQSANALSAGMRGKARESGGKRGKAGESAGKRGKARESAGGRVVIGLRFASDWLRLAQVSGLIT